MSNKKHPQKSAESKPEAEAEVITAQEQPPAEEAPAEVAPAVELPAAEPIAEEIQTDPVVAPVDPASDELPATEESEVPAVIETVAEEPKEPELVEVIRDCFSTRLTKAVISIQTSGKSESVQALNKLEMLIGDLRNALPAAIEASSDVTIDQELEGDLQSLFAAL